MTDFDINEFLTVLHEAVPSTKETELSTLELDRYIQAYRNGAHDTQSLLAAVARPEPTVTLYAHLNADDLEQVGQQIGLTDAALRKFISAADLPIELNCSVESDGTVIIEAVAEMCELSWGCAL